MVISLKANKLALFRSLFNAGHEIVVSEKEGEKRDRRERREAPHVINFFVENDLSNDS